MARLAWRARFYLSLWHISHCGGSEVGQGGSVGRADKRSRGWGGVGGDGDGDRVSSAGSGRRVEGGTRDPASWGQRRRVARRWRRERPESLGREGMGVGEGQGTGTGRAGEVAERALGERACTGRSRNLGCHRWGVPMGPLHAWRSVKRGAGVGDGRHGHRPPERGPRGGPRHTVRGDSEHARESRARGRA
ncbi:hypothetical protein MARPO_0502s0002 [Marchantia polymorpha]|uniref:Uncharacterized protein n=1 Tax=Marchantia polymorpha TaxID=3197 RepID=A0A2R6VYQ6_MARPO|nr:hypothetical protein MARPO_0502s0002 [Marchantia polymorpha]|eukprot:PTQ26733.1 hypothetical protein MARPO_0502s0002 [Marchantia polymorpha]